MDFEESYPLLEQLKHYGLDYLIPAHFNSDDSDDEGYAHTHRGMLDEMIDPTDDRYYGDFDFENEGLESFVPVEFEYEEAIALNLDDFCRLFNIDYMDPEELMEMNLWDLFGISKKQLDMINFSQIAPEDFRFFYNVFVDEKRDLPIEKKIRYSIATATTDYRRICFSTGAIGKHYDERVAYCERIIDTHTLSETIELMQLLLDYWRCYNDALEMDEIRRAEGQETFDYVEMPKPSHLKDFHDKAFRDHAELATRKMSEKKEQLNAMIKAISDSKDYQRFLYRNDKYVVIAVTSQDDLNIEGEYLNHCVASYGSYMANGESYIYLVRKADDLETPYFTAEIIPAKNPPDRYKMTQLYTFNDSIEKPEELRQFVRDWAINNKFTIKCII